MTFPKGVIEVLSIGIDEEGMLYIATKMEDQDTLDLLEDAFDVMSEKLPADPFTLQ
jgi:hypothetical protein